MQTFERTIRAFCETVRHGRAPLATGFDGFRETEVDCGMEISARTDERYGVELYRGMDIGVTR